MSSYSDKIRINFCSVEELTRIPGIGRKLAVSIVGLRESAGNLTPEALAAISRHKFSEEVLRHIDFERNQSAGGAESSDEGEEDDDFVEASEVQPQIPGTPKGQATWGGKFWGLWESVSRLWSSAPPKPVTLNTESRRIRRERRQDLNSMVDLLPRVNQPAAAQSQVGVEIPLATSLARRLDLSRDITCTPAPVHASTPIPEMRRQSQEPLTTFAAELSVPKAPSVVPAPGLPDPKVPTAPAAPGLPDPKVPTAPVQVQVPCPTLSVPPATQVTGDRDPGQVRPTPPTDEALSRRGPRTPKELMKMLPRQFSYDGKGDWESFEMQFTLSATAHQWTDAERIECLCWCLSGKALTFFTLINKQRNLSYQELFTRLKNRFSEPDTPDTAQSKFQQAYQFAGESLEEWADRVLTLASKAYCDLPEKFTTEQSVTRFVQGLQDREAAQQVCMMSPSSVHQALQWVRKHQQCHFALQGKSKVDRPRRKNDNEATDPCVSQVRSEQDHSKEILQSLSELQSRMSKIDALESRMAKMEKRSSRPPGKGRARSSACFACGEDGHFKRDCPKQGLNRSRLGQEAASRPGK